MIFTVFFCFTSCAIMTFTARRRKQQELRTHMWCTFACVSLSSQVEESLLKLILEPMLRLLQEPPGTNQTPRPNAAEHAPPTAALHPCGTAPAVPVLQCPKAASAPEHASKLKIDGLSIIEHHAVLRDSIDVTFHVTTCNFSVERLVTRHRLPAQKVTCCR